ncbi:MAG TPA: patatin-like phospholipase family protein [Gemmatimonadales bacterium]|nr:patatin-like phospholipase family protein [Gemmatimonadales bacterium]
MTAAGWRFALVLGGGGTKGLAHVGVLRALAEREWTPDVVVGNSIGALVGAAWASDFTVAELEAVALSMQRRDVFAIARSEMAARRLRAPGIYKGEPLEDLVRGILGDATFDELPRRLIVASVDVNSGTALYWGLPGLRDVSVADAVFASCALPGFFPPREIHDRFLVDGALVDNLPVAVAAAQDVEGIVAVDVGSSGVLRAEVQESGFASVVARGSEIVFHHMLELRLAHWTSPPMLLVQPRVEHVPMFSFAHNRELIDEGHRATAAALDQAEAVRRATGGIFPRRLVEVAVDRERCIGCGACVALGPPGTFRMDASGKAVGPSAPQEWSPISGGVVCHCPTYAITAHPMREAAGGPTGGGSTGTARARA